MICFFIDGFIYPFLSCKSLTSWTVILTSQLLTGFQKTDLSGRVQIPAGNSVGPCPDFYGPAKCTTADLSGLQRFTTTKPTNSFQCSGGSLLSRWSLKQVREVVHPLIHGKCLVIMARIRISKKGELGF